MFEYERQRGEGRERGGEKEGKRERKRGERGKAGKREVSCTGDRKKLI